MLEVGRPPQSPEGRADALVKFRLRAEEKAALEKAAKAEGKKLSEWIRENLRRLAKPALNKRRQSKA